MHKLTLSASAAALVMAAAVPAAPAVAQPVSQPPRVQGDLAGFRGGPNALPSAIRKVDRETGGRVLEIRFDDRRGRPGYDVAVARGRQVIFARLRGSDGHVIPIADREQPAWMMDWRRRKDVRLRERARVPLTRAVLTAEDSAGGRAVAAGVATSASNPTTNVHAYNVMVDDGGMVRRVAIDDRTGQVITDPDALSSWP